MKRGPLQQIYHLKLALVGVLALVLGVALSVVADSLSTRSNWHLASACFASLSDFLVVTGGIGIAIDFFTGKAKEDADTERTRDVIRSLTPEFTDAVVKGLAVNDADLQRVANPDLLDGIAKNVLSQRLGDRLFAEEIYADIRDLAIRAPERWHDVEVKIRLSAIAERNTGGVPVLDAIVSWEYTVVPTHAVQRFACTSDRDEFHELVSDTPATSTWFMTQRPGFDASSKACFELLSYSINGDDRPIRRTARKTGQSYLVAVGEDVVRTKEPVRVRHTYRTVADPANHRLFVAIAQPARDVSVEVDYSDAGISRMTVTDLVSSVRRPHVSQLPAQSSGKELTIEVAGWVQAGTGFTFVWTLDSEEPPPPQRHHPTAPRSAA